MASTVLALLFAQILWSGGLWLHHTAQADAWRGAALRIAWLGMFAASGLWLLLALHHRRPRRLPGVATALVLAPTFVFFVAALTNASHGWIFLPDSHSDPGLADLARWAEPLGYVLAALALCSGLAGSLLFALSAVRLWVQGERRRALALGLALAGAVAACIAALSGGLEVDLPIGAASLTLATLVLAVTALRYQILEPPPLGHREVIDHLRHGVLMASATGEILDHNPAAERLLGVVPRGRSLADVVAALASDDRRELVRAALCAMEDAAEPVALQIEARDGKHVEVSARPIRSDGRDGSDQARTLGQVATLRDRTEERRYANAALRTQQLETVGTLAAGIAHEVNNPLAFVRANLSEIARLAEHVDARRRSGPSKLAEELHELGELAHDALEGLLRIQRAVSDVRRLAAAPSAGLDNVSLETVVLDAVRLADLRGGSRVEIHKRLAPGLPMIQGSRQLLAQAVLNLLLNAREALEGAPNPRIEIETGESAHAQWVRVRDNGPGVPEALRERIFEPFFTTTPDRSGRGLGLCVAADIAHEHGGSLWTEPSGTGASFVLHIAASRGD